mmetsp:Transcript_33213/g.77637  ORF Transcript_33213/g.77637 Transcript_33213/m.77637 type:complete len:488 (+) Transcript_33213:497-1960(+)
MAESAKSLVLREALRFVHGEDGLHRLLELRELHPEDGLDWLGRPLCLGRVPAEPQLVHVRARADESELCHVRPRAPVGAAGGARDEVRVAEPHLLELLCEPRVDVGLHALCLGDGEAAQRERRACDRLAREGVHLVDQLDAVHPQAELDALPVGRADVAQHHRLRRREQQVDAGEIVDDRAQPRLDPHFWCVAHPPLLDVHAEHVLTVPLVMPAHPIDVLPLGKRPPRLKGLAEVLLGERTEVVDAEGVHQILEPRVGTHLAVAVVALHGEDGLHRLKEDLLAHIPEVRRSTSERRLVLVRAPHAAAHDDVEAGECLAVGLHDDDTPDVVDVQVDAVVAGHGEGDLELLWQVRAPVDGLDRVAGDDAIAVVVRADLVQLKLLDVLLPILDCRCLLAVKPYLVERARHRLEQVCKRLGVLLAVHVRRVVREMDRRSHQISVDVATPAIRVRSDVGNGRDDRLEVALEDAVQLEGLPRRGAQVALAVLV